MMNLLAAEIIDELGFFFLFFFKPRFHTHLIYPTLLIHPQLGHKTDQQQSTLEMLHIETAH